MNKMKKLLSVLLAVIMILSSMSVMASAAVTQYQTVDNLKALDAYSPYGQVTRLSTEERASIIQDALDNILKKANINMGTLIDFAGITINVNLTTIDNLCATIDDVKDALSNGLVSLAKAFVNLGILESISLDTWATGITRAGSSQLLLFSELFELLQANRTTIANILREGKLDLGIINLGDMSAIENILGDLPGMVKGLVFPLLERKDDELSEIKNLDTWGDGDGNVELAVNTFVQNLFKDNRSTTTVKYDANGNMTSEHDGLPLVSKAPAENTELTDATSKRVVYYKDTDGKLWTYHIVDAKEAEALAKDDNDNNNYAAYTYIKEEYPYTLQQEVEGSSTYVWKATDEWNNTWTLKYYNDNSQWLPDLTAALEAGTVSIDLSSNDVSAGDLLYTFIPYVFEEMAPVVLNGSMKKILGGLFGANYKYIGSVGENSADKAAVEALADYNTNNTGKTTNIFKMEQGEYLWEWSYYEIINGNHYYRFQDQIFQADLSNVNNYFYIIDWNYEITGDFMNDFVPANDSDVNTRLLNNVNDFLVKVANTVFVDKADTVNTSGEGTEYYYERAWELPTLSTGSNSYLVENIKAIAQAFIKLAPEHIFGSDYADNERCYYELMISSDNDTVLTGIAAHIVDMVMPSMYLPGKSQILASKAKVGAILAAVVREFAAYLAPEYNYDALIYADFGTTTADKDKTFVDPEAEGLLTEGSTVSGYWFDVILTMGLDVGFEYLRAFADMGEGTTQWTSFVSYSGYGEDGKTYAAGTTQAALNAQWEGMLDYVVDWALEKDYEWTWKMENLVKTTDANGTALTIDLATAQDPWVKLDLIFDSLLPVDEILTITGEEDMGITELEKLLRYDLILGIVDLNWADLINILQFNGTNKYFRSGNILDQLAGLLKNLINGIFAKVGGGSYALIPAAMTDFDTLANQQNIAQLVEDLLNALPTAYTNGLLDTVFPLLNMFLGWKTDVQKIADPQIWETFRDNNDYAFQWTGNGVYPTMDADNTVIHFLNNSSGMLETHRNSDVVDHEYAIQIKSVTSDATVNTLTFDYGDGYASPYETIDIKIGGTYNGEEAVTVTIAYEYIGKDGNAVGGTLYTTRTIFFSNQFEDSNVTEAEGSMDSGVTWQTKRAAYNKYIFSEDIYTAITEASVSVRYKNSISGSTPFKQVEAPDLSVEVPNDNGTPDDTCDDYSDWLPVDYPEYDQYAETYFGYNNDQASSGWPSEISSNLITGWGQGSGKFYAGKAEYGADYDYPLGIYAFQPVSVTYDGEAVYQQVFIHYDDYGIYELYTDNKENGYNAKQGVSADLYNAYNTAWKEVVRLATYPMMTELNNNNTASDYLKEIMPDIQPAMAAFETAKEAYEKALAEAQASASADASLPSYISDLQAEIDNDFMNGKEINFQDYEFYEYFNYNDVKVAAENLYRSYLAPEVMDTYYIEGSGIREAELDKVIEAEANSFIAAGISASRMKNDQAAIDASIAAQGEWKQPVTTRLYADDFTSRLAYYKQFLNEANREGNDHLYFLNKEISHVEAQEFVEDEYTAASWAKYADALAEAKAVAAGEDEFSSFNSRIYDVKYNLMVARKNLLKKTDSLIEQGGTKTLEGNITTANDIFASLAAADGAWVLKEGVDADTAYAALISALGYYYTGEDENVWNLYADSALEYADNDRPNRQSNQVKVNTANAELEAAIANFEPAATEPNTIMVKEDYEYASNIVIDTTNNNGETFEYTGLIYGIDTLDQNPDMNAFTTLADSLTTAYGDEYLEVVVGDAGVETTGTLINVLDEDGNVVETYVFVYFGDIDMDGMISSYDGFLAETYEGTYEGIESYAQYVAADIDADGMISSYDGFLAETYEGSYEGVDYQYVIAESAQNNEYIME